MGKKQTKWEREEEQNKPCFSSITRRDFLNKFSKAALGLSLVPAHILFGQENRVWAKPQSLSRVVVVLDQNATDGSWINQQVIQTMVDTGIMALTQEPTVGEAWGSVFPGITPLSVIGVKVNAFNPSLPSHPEIATAVANGIKQISTGSGSFNENNIIIWDRTDAELVAAGYDINNRSSGVRYMNTQNPAVGGNDYTVDLHVHDVVTHPSKLLTQFCDHIVGLACLKNHVHAGVTLGMKNFVGAISDFSIIHPNNCDPYLPALIQEIQNVFDNVFRISIIDALFGVSVAGQGGVQSLSTMGLSWEQTLWLWIMWGWRYWSNRDVPLWVWLTM